MKTVHRLEGGRGVRGGQLQLFAKRLWEKRRKSTQQSQKVIWLSCNQWVLIVKQTITGKGASELGMDTNMFVSAGGSQDNRILCCITIFSSGYFKFALIKFASFLSFI